MLPCIDPSVRDFLVASTCKDELINRVCIVLQELGTPCFRDLGKEIDVAPASMYALIRGTTKEPSLTTLDKLVRYLAPGYELALIPAEAEPVESAACVPNLQRKGPRRTGTSVTNATKDAAAKTLAAIAAEQRAKYAFPPVGWKVHPHNSDYYYRGQEVLSEAQLRALVAAE